MEVGVYLAKTGPFSPAMKSLGSLGCEMLLFEARDGESGWMDKSTAYLLAYNPELGLIIFRICLTNG